MKALTHLSQPDTTQIINTLDEDGAVIVDALVTSNDADQLRHELDALLENASFGNAFGGRQTRRICGLAACSPRSRPLLLNETVLAAAHTFLAQWTQQLLLNNSQAIQLHPGQPAQAIHRDRLAWGHLPTEIEPQLSTIWAVSDFTSENGATQVVPGSHRWKTTRRPQADEIVQATMAAGSVLIYTGSVLHGGGENRAETTRRLGVNISYCLSWLRPEENHLLSCPPSIARDLDPALQEMLGYAMSDHGLGYFASARGIMSMPQKALGQDVHNPGEKLAAYINGALDSI